MSVVHCGRMHAAPREPVGMSVMVNKVTKAVAIVEHPNLARIEVRDETGRADVRRGVSVTLRYQDGGRTLKVFVKEGEEE